jgi:pilus assembly protein CpaC
MTQKTIQPNAAPRLLWRGFLFLTCFALAFAAVATARANGDAIQLNSVGHSVIKVAKGKPRTVRTAQPFYEIVIGDPAVANVSPLTDQSFYVLGNELGTTGIALFDDAKQLVGTVDIEVTLDTERLASTIREAVPGSDIRVGSANGRLVLSGSAEDAVAADRAQRIATRFSGEEEIINSVDIASSQQVQLNVRFVEVNRQVGHELSSKIGARYVGAGGGVSFNSQPNSTSSNAVSDIIAGFTSGGFSIDVAIKALEDRGVARRLAEPNLIARSGERASFLAGGEFPIPIASDGDSIAVSYKKYGVSLDFMPTVLSDGLISLQIEPEVSSIDTSASYRFGDIAIPGFTVRRAQTSVDLKSGQSFMIAGLLQTQNDQVAQQLPGVSRLPVLGALFSSKAYQRRETDLVIIITPFLVQPMDPTKKPRTPMDNAVAGSNLDYFLGNVEERTPGGNQLGALAAYAPSAGSGAAALPAFGHFLELE